MHFSRLISRSINKIDISNIEAYDNRRGFQLNHNEVIMNNIAIILAAGSGRETGSNIPMQFVNVYDKPILIYTLEGFQRHPQIDAIEVVCLKGWTEAVKAYAQQFNISKLKWLIEGRASTQESIRDGIYNLKNKVKEEDIIVIHDGIRPMVDVEVLTDVLLVAKRYGNAISSLPYNEQIFVVDEEDESQTKKFIPRETVRRVSSPQAFRFGRLDEIYHKAFDEGRGIEASTYSDTLMVDYGEKLYFAAGSDKNIKIVTKRDLELFMSFLKIDKDIWLK